MYWRLASRSAFTLYYATRSSRHAVTSINGESRYSLQQSCVSDFCPVKPRVLSSPSKRPPYYSRHVLPIVYSAASTAQFCSFENVVSGTMVLCMELIRIAYLRGYRPSLCSRLRRFHCTFYLTVYFDVYLKLNISTGRQ